MNILISSGSYIFSDYFPGGEFQITYAIASRLAQRGNKVYVFAPLKKLKREIPNLTVLEVGGYDFVNSKTYFHYFWNWWKFSIKAYLKAKRLIEEVSIDIIHHLRPAFPYKFSLCWKLNRPFIYGPISLTWRKDNKEDEEETKWEKGGILNFFRNKLIDRLNMNIGRYLWTIMLKKADCLMVSVDEAMNNIPQKYHSKVRILPLGVDTNLFTPIATATGNLRILFVGNLIKQKGLQYLLKAIPKVKRQFPEIILTVVGNGKDEGYFRKLCEEFQITNNVFFKGSVPFNEIVVFYQECDVFCLPSLGEPFGISILQAMSCGKPVIVTNVGGPPHFVEDDKSGYLVPPSDSDSLTKALINLLSNREKQRKMGEYNRKLCVERYDWERIVDEIELIYGELCLSR